MRILPSDFQKRK